jgi:uncharacterized membrane protein YphA (DoxX/SURF4 family)
MRAFFERMRPFAPVPIRLLVAAMLFHYGIGKLVPASMAAFKGTVTGWGLPAWMALALGWGAAVSGALLAVGLLTRLAALVGAAALVLVFIKTHPHVSINDTHLLALQVGACLSLFLSGAGRFSVDRKLFGGP